MGRLILPLSGLIYADAQIPIYSVDNHLKYGAICAPLWQVKAGATLVSSELTLMETLVGPLRSGNTVRQNQREALWQQVNTRLLPITQDVLREAARLRATIPALKTPDAIHAATALRNGCVLFVSNDTGFRRIPGLPLVLLDDVLAAPQANLSSAACHAYGITAAETISRTRRRPSSPPMLPSLKGVRGMGFQLSRDVST